MQKELLVQFGLTEKEADLYLLLIEKGEVPVKELIDATRLKRATVYKSLSGLEAKGLLVSREFKKKLHVSPLPPENILTVAQKRLAEVQEAHKGLLSVIQELNSKFVLSTQKPVVSVFKGENGLKKIYEDMLIEAKPIVAVLQYHDVHDELKRWLDGPFTKKRIAKKIPVRTIVSGVAPPKHYIELSESGYREVRWVNKPLFMFKHEVSIYGDKIAFLNHKKGEKLVGILIRNESMAATLRALWELAWVGAKMED